MNTTPRRRGVSVRMKLALSYAGFLIVAGGALFAVGLLMLRFVPDSNLTLVSGGFSPNRSDLLRVFVRYAWWAMALLLAFGLVGGWMLAGIVLRPLSRITAAAGAARGGRFDRRVALSGHRDELTDLADTLDAMLDRVAHTIDEERRFAANASHELRTPHAIIRTIVEVAQADPDGRDVDRVLHRIGTTNDRAIATTEALLALSRVGHGSVLATETVDLTAIVTERIEELQADAAARGISVQASLRPASVTAHRPLVSQLVANLLHNAVVHNVEGGWICIDVADAEIVVANGGPRLNPTHVTTLTEPFTRGAGRVQVTGGHDGSGLGLTIVSSIVEAHRGTLTLRALPDGGLQVAVALPR